jgi:transcription elongation factor GreA
MSEVVYYTEQGLQKLKDEIHQLKMVERPRISQQIAEARDKGDLSENAEYDAAKEAQGLLEMRIAKLEQTLGNARVIDESKIDTSKVLALSVVSLVNHTNKMKMKYQLVPESEANLKEGKISIKSPIAQSLLGKSVGEVVDVKVPSGVMKLEITDIGR